MSNSCDKHLIENLKEAIDFLEDRKKLINDNIQIYDDEEKTSFSESWLMNTWQVNTDIDRLRGLLHKCQYNSWIVSEEEVKQLTAWLHKKYGIDVGK